MASTVSHPLPVLVTSRPKEASTNLQKNNNYHSEQLNFQSDLIRPLLIPRPSY